METCRVTRTRILLAVLVLTWIVLGAAASTQVSAAPEQAIIPIYWGAIVRGSHYGLPEPPWDMRAIDVFEAHAGKKLSIIHFGQSWYSNSASVGFPKGLFDNVRNHGAIPLFTWSSRDSALPMPDQPAFRNSVITGGTYDSYIRQWATDAKNWGHPFFLRFDWEMNGWWYPWAEGSRGTTGIIPNGNHPGDYAAMWRHVHDIFTQVGATNVTWVWCINEMSNTTAGKHPPMDQIYPGDAYVDWTGFDVYNRYSGWESFNTTLTGAGTNWLLNTYQSTFDIAPSKPMIVVEFGSKEDRTNATRKAGWLTDALLTQLPNNFPQIKGIVYFNWNTTSDPNNPDSSVAIESSPQSQAAFAQGIASPYYAANWFADLPPGPIQPIASPVPTTATPVTTSLPSPTNTATRTPSALPSPTRTATPVTAPAPTQTSTRVPSPVPTQAQTVYAADSFARVLTDGWGSTNPGGTYTLVGGTAAFDVDGHAGSMRLKVENATRSAYLNEVSAQDIEFSTRFSIDKLPGGASQIVYLVARHVASSTHYLGRARLGTDGTIRLVAMSEVNGTQTQIGGEKTVVGVAPAVNKQFWLKARVVGTNPTTLQLRLWADGQAEPTGWQYTATDSTAALQGPGAVGLRSYLGRGATNAPVSVGYHELEVGSAP